MPVPKNKSIQVEQRQRLQQDILQKIVEGKDSISDVLNELCLQIERMLPSAICSIMVLNEDTGTLQVGAVPSGGETACTILDGLVPSEFGGACGTAVHTGTTVVIEDTETDPRWEPIREAARPLGIKSCWSIPITGADQRVIGTFAISHPHVQSPSPSDLQLLETASSLASIALQRTTDLESLSASENRYRDLYESAPFAYFTSHMDGRIKSANASAVELLGYPLTELKDRSVIDLYAPTKDGRVKAKKLQAKTQKGQEIDSEELEMQRADGTHIWVSLTVRLIRDAHGTLLERRGIVQDITARKKAEERLLLTKFVIDHAGDAIFMAGPDKRLLYANEAASHSLGYRPEQLIGKSIADVSPTHDPQTFTQRLQNLAQNHPLQYESRHRTSQGKEFPVELTLSALEHQGDQYTCAIVRDITDRKMGEELLASQKTILEMISTKKPIRDILSSVCLMVEHHATHMYCSIHLLEENMLRNGAAPSLPDSYTRRLDGLAIGPVAGSCGTAAYRKEPVVVSDIANDPLWERGKNLALRHGLQACWSTPILSSTGSVIGTFAMYDEEPRTPNPESFKLVEIATSLAGIAIEQQHAETALQKSEERYRDLYESAPFAYFTIHMDGRIKTVNTSAVDLLGYSLEELKERRMIDLYAPTRDGRERAQHIQHQTLQGEEAEQEELVMQRADGTHIWVSLTVRLIKDEMGTLIERRALVNDISKRKRIEHLQKLQQSALELTVTGAPLSEILNSLCTQVELMVPQAICSILTLDPSTQFLTFQAGPSVPPELADALDGMVPGPCAGSCGTATFRGEPVYVVNTATDPLWAKLRDAAKKFNIGACWSYPIYSDGKQVLGSFAISSSQPHSPQPGDIQLLETVSFLAGIAIQRKAKEQALTDSERRYRSLYEDNPSMYFTVSSEGTILSVNQFGASQLGYTVQELLEAPVSTLFLAEDHETVHHHLMQCLDHPQELGHWEIRKIRKDGKIIWVRETVRAIQNHDNQSVFLIVCDDITQQKEIEELIRKGEKKFRAIYEQAPTGIATLDSLSGQFTQINQKYCDIVGYSQEEMVGKSFEELTHRDDLQPDLDLMQQLLAGKINSFQLEKRYYRKNGEVIWVNLTCVPLWGESTQVRQHIAMVEDITQRKLAEEKLHEMNMALSNAMPGIAQINPAGRYLEVNESYAAMLGYTTQELVGNSWEPTVDSEDLPSAHAAYQIMIQTGKGEFDAKGIRKDGSTFYKHVLMVKKVDKNGSLIGHHCFMRDITERKLGEEALRESDERLQGILDNSSAVMYVKDLHGHYILINREYERIFNLDRETVKGKSDFDLFPYEIAKAFTENDQKVLEHGDSMEWEEVAPQQDGLHTYISNKFPLRNAQGKPYAICGISTDITQRKQAELNIMLRNHILESSPNGIIITDTQKSDNPIIYANAAFEKMTGYAQEDVLGRNCRFLQQDDIDQDGLKTIRSALQKKQECQVVLRNYKKDGTLFWNDLRLAPVFHIDGTLRHYIGVLTDITQRKSIDDSLRALAEANSTLTGEDFFPFIVKSLASCLNVKYAFITKSANPTPTHLRTLAFWNTPTFAENFEYPLAGTPCEVVMKGDLCFYRHNVQQHFPDDQDLKTFDVESYVGYPLFTKSGEILGHIVAMGNKAIPENSPAEAIIKLFATRAAAELERNKAESQIREAYEQKREISARLEAAEESERKRISRELHDEFGQMLTALKFDLSWVQRRLSEQAVQTPNDSIQTKTQSMMTLTDELIQTVRRIATSLRPTILDDLGLVPALEWHALDFQKRTGIQCSFATELDATTFSLESDRATALFRITQELFTNILRHAEASHVQVNLQRDNGFLTLSVQDNGQGLPKRTKNHAPSLGLLGIRERAASFGGDFHIQNKSGSGTQATVRIPMAQKPLKGQTS